MALLASLRHQVLDVGAYKRKILPTIPIRAEAVGKAGSTARSERGFASVARRGANVAANHLRGILAGMGTDTYSASGRLARQHQYPRLAPASHREKLPKTWCALT